MRLRFLIFLLGMYSLSLFPQTVAWELTENGIGVSDNQKLVPLDFSFGSGLTSTTFAASGAYAKGWSTEGLDANDYFQVAVCSNASDTLELMSIAYSERRSNSSIRDYEIKYSSDADFLNSISLGVVHLPDNDQERDTIIEDLGIWLLPDDTVFVRWYGYHSEGNSGTWRINNGSLKLQFQTYTHDLTPPQLIYAKAISDKKIALMFDDKLDTLSIQKEDFRLQTDIHPIGVDKEMFRQGKLILEFENSFPLEENMTLYYQQISDDAGNVIDAEQSVNLVYYLPEAFCVLITEIMADPSPSVYLPESEYIELYNTKPFPISLKDWSLQINTSHYSVGDLMIDGHSFALLVPNEKAALFDDSLNVYELFANNKLTNSGGKVKLLDAQNQWICQVDYAQDWHQESYKKEGGWSLEMIDLDFPCDMQNNWTSSLSNLGGTPGNINSVDGVLSYVSYMNVEYAYWQDCSCIVKFNQMLAPDYVPNPSLFELDGEEAQSVFYTSGNDVLEIVFDNDLQPQTTYTLTIRDTIVNCSGEVVALPLQLPLGLPDAVEHGDLVINELLFNPKNQHVQYLEIYNVSDKIIDLQELKLGVQKNDGIDYASSLFDIPVIIFPKDYLVVTKNKADILQVFNVKYPDKLFQTNEIPRISIQKGHLFLANKGDLVIDEVLYDEAYHSPVLYDNEGVALEKINPQLSGVKAQSWQSASQASGFGTPTYQNSQYSEMSEHLSAQFELKNEIFSPDMDGYQDYMLLNYHLEKSGYQAQVKIYDAQGRLVKDLVSNEYTGMQGVWTWDGKNNQGQRQAMGIYVIYVELTHPDGDVLQQKMTCTLVAKMR